MSEQTHTKTDEELGDDLRRALAEYDAEQERQRQTPSDNFAEDMIRLSRGELDADVARAKYRHLLDE